MSLKEGRQKKPLPIIYDRLPDEGKQKVDNFKRAYNIYFKNQTNAGLALKVTQGTIYRYLVGIVLVPMEVARRFEQFSNGAITVDSIFFDYNEYLYDQRLAKKKEIVASSECLDSKQSTKKHKHEIT